jgi:arylsulfatase A-like enzyme
MFAQISFVKLPRDDVGSALCKHSASTIKDTPPLRPKQDKTMRLLSFFWRRIWALLSSLLLIIIVLIVWAALRISGSNQVDDEFHMSSKQAYLDSLSSTIAPSATPPNILFVLYDDLGYGDIGHGAGGLIKTPNIDKLASNGVMLSDFHSPAPVCTPSRAGFLTGRLPARAGLPNVVFPTGSLKSLLIDDLLAPNLNKRLPAEEITLANILNAVGYNTAMIGKWHMGDRSPSLPNDMGFEQYYGALYSNDMEPFAFYRNAQIALEAPVDQTRMSELYANEASAFIESQTDRPFFLYFAHNFPHDPLASRPQRNGSSDAGLFGDVMEEIDDGIGQIVTSLEKVGKLENTLIIISSDNGPWFLGNAGDQRGRKGNTFEGGMRVPFIAHWPAAISPGRVEPAMAMGTDLVPTVLEILGMPAPTDRILDGKSILPVLTSGGDTPHDYLYYHDGEVLFAARSQRFKYRGPAGVFYSTDQMSIGATVPQKEWLFDLNGDPRESYDTSNRYPKVTDELRTAFEAKVSDMAANPRGWK